MAGLFVRRSTDADETRRFGKGQMGLVKFGESSIGRAAFEPGWRWSEQIGPIEGTKSCQHSHAGYCLAGRMRIRMDDGTENEIGPGDLFVIEPGHDAWILGTETCVLLDFQGMADYAMPHAPGTRAGRGAGEERVVVH